MKASLHAELTTTRTGRAIAILNGFPGGHDAMMDGKQLRALASCLTKIADAVESGQGGEIELEYSLEYFADLADDT